jgi:hypothetical protein
LLLLLRKRKSKTAGRIPAGSILFERMGKEEVKGMPPEKPASLL